MHTIKIMAKVQLENSVCLDKVAKIEDALGADDVCGEGILGNLNLWKQKSINVTEAEIENLAGGLRLIRYCIAVYRVTQ